MKFDPDNKVVALCIEGMARENRKEYKEAQALFQQAWEIASDDFEKFTAAHYVARLQPTVAEKLEWDKCALEWAMNIPEEGVKGSYPSLYLNIGKGYEDLNDRDRALEYYEKALFFCTYLGDNNYGKMTREGIQKGIQRVREK